MSNPRWDRLAGIFLDALERPSAERARFLAGACAGDDELRREVDDMLAAEEGAALRIEQRLLADGRAHSLEPGTLVGAYRIESLVGEGGMGEVYRAERVGAYEQAVAFKVLRPGLHGAEMLQRFRRERQILARLVHPDIAAILDGGQLDDGRPYLVLQYVDGVPITDYCTANRLDLAGRLRLVKRVCDVVQFAHGRMVIHRDLKPSNILITQAGDPKLLDFGIAKLLDPDDADVRTRTEWRLMTREYAAPEQLRGEPTSAATDVYALGVLLYQILTGTRPSTKEPTIAPSTVVGARSDARRLRGDLDRIVLMALRHGARAALRFRRRARPTTSSVICRVFRFARSRTLSATAHASSCRAIARSSHRPSSSPYCWRASASRALCRRAASRENGIARAPRRRRPTP